MNSKKKMYRLVVTHWKNSILTTEEFQYFNLEECHAQAKKYTGQIKIYDDNRRIVHNKEQAQHLSPWELKHKNKNDDEHNHYS
jgi:hypothetical protein